MIKITNEVALKSGEVFLGENLRVLEPSFQLHFDVINKYSLEWENRRSFPIEEIYSIELIVLHKTY